MLFSSLQFVLFFLPIFLAIYYVVPNSWKKYVLLIGSVSFYCIGSYYSFFFFIISMIVNFGFNKLMLRDGEKTLQSPVPKMKIFWLVIICLWNIGILVLFKYWDFIAVTIKQISGRDYLPTINAVLPLGISFYTFQVLAFQVDCFRGTVKTPVSILDFLVYMTMFPQLISGPIVKYSIYNESAKKPYVNYENLENGAKTFVFGLGLKVLLANQIGTLWNSIQVSGVDSISTPIAWLGALAYSMQLYFDFWGYSVMAIGLGQMIGYKIPQNFKNPYIATSVSEFWRRWHITLGSWFREYIYFPLGGSRCSKAKMIRNLFFVWIFTGLWHGASWNFWIWGIALFVLMTLEKLFVGKILEKYSLLGHIYILFIIPITWVIFAINELNVLFQYLCRMFGIVWVANEATTKQLIRYGESYWWLLLIGLLFMTPIPMNFFKEKNKSWYMNVLLFMIFWISMYEIYMGKNNPFLYFGF